MSENQNFLSPVGRLVQGDCFVPVDKNKIGQPLTDKQGKPRVDYTVIVAFPKTDATFGQLWALFEGVAKAGFPALLQAGMLLPPWDPRTRFSWKIQDGDGYDGDGKPNSGKPGFAGHWIVKFKSGFAPKCFYAGRYAPHEQITDTKAIPRGYYVRVAGSVSANGDANKPGLYVNLNMVELVGGEPSMIIQSGPDASAVFGSAPAAVLPQGVPAIAMGALPQGVPAIAMGALPQAGAQMGNGLPTLGGMPALPAGPAALPAMNGPASLGAVAPMAGLPTLPQTIAVQPNPAILMGDVPQGLPSASAVQGLPPMGGGLPGSAPGLAGAASGATTYPSSPAGLPALTPPVSATPQLTAKAAGYTYEQLRGQGYTDDVLRQHGFIL